MSQVVTDNPIINSPPRIERPHDNQPNPFVDFNSGPSDFEQKVDFCHYEQSWSNRLMSNYKLSDQGRVHEVLGRCNR